MPDLLIEFVSDADGGAPDFSVRDIRLESINDFK